MTLRARLRTFWLIGAIAVLVALPSATASAQVPALASVPDNLPEALRSPLLGERRTLASRLEGLQAIARDHNARCATVKSGTREAAACRARFDELTRDRMTYSEAATAFNARVAQAVTPKSQGDAAERAAEDRIALSSPAAATSVRASGDVQMLDDRGVRHRELAPVQMVRSGYEFETGVSGRVQLKVADSWGLVIPKQSRVGFEKVVRDAQMEITALTLRLRSGGLHVYKLIGREAAKLPKTRAQIRVTTHVSDAILATRATEYEVNVAPGGDTAQLKVISGIVDVTSGVGDPPVVVNVGEMLIIERGRIGKPVPIPGFGLCSDPRCRRDVPCGSVQCEFEN